AGTGVCMCGSPMAEHPHDNHSPCDEWDHYGAILLSDSPTTSLARRDALKRAEALEWAVRHIKDGMAREFLASNLADIECEADMSRRRAEESPHG
ncbi:hypothetical protein, partial [Halomonas salifodinae]